MTYTRRCTGDLAISYKGSVVAQLFHTVGNYKPFHVYDICNGGAPSEYRHLVDALERMEEIATDNIEHIDSVLAD